LQFLFVYLCGFHFFLCLNILVFFLVLGETFLCLLGYVQGRGEGQNSTTKFICSEIEPYVEISRFDLGSDNVKFWILSDFFFIAPTLQQRGRRRKNQIQQYPLHGSQRGFPGWNNPRWPWTRGLLCHQLTSPPLYINAVQP
jgi:hypothetical protein